MDPEIPTLSTKSEQRKKSRLRDARLPSRMRTGRSLFSPRMLHKMQKYEECRIDAEALYAHLQRLSVTEYEAYPSVSMLPIHIGDYFPFFMDKLVKLWDPSFKFSAQTKKMSFLSIVPEISLKNHSSLQWTEPLATQFDYADKMPQLYIDLKETELENVDFQMTIYIQIDASSYYIVPSCKAEIDKRISAHSIPSNDRPRFTCYVISLSDNLLSMNVELVSLSHFNRAIQHLPSFSSTEICDFDILHIPLSSSSSSSSSSDFEDDTSCSSQRLPTRRLRRIKFCNGYRGDRNCARLSAKEKRASHSKKIDSYT